MLVQLRDFTKSPYAHSAERFSDSWIEFVTQQLGSAERDTCPYNVFVHLTRARYSTTKALAAIEELVAVAKARIKELLEKDRGLELDQLEIESARAERSRLLQATDWIEYIELIARQIYLTCANPRVVPCQQIKDQSWQLFAGLMTSLSITDTPEGVKVTFDRFTEMCNNVLPGS